MSVETSRKFAWVCGTEAQFKLSPKRYARIMADIVNAVSEEDFRKETKNFIAEARRERVGSGRVA